MESDDGHLSIVRRCAGRFDIEVDGTGPAGVIEPPMLTALEARGDQVEMARIKLRLCEGEVVIVPGLPGRREAGDTGLLQEALPIEQALLPQSAFCGRPDALKEDKRGGQHLRGL